MDLKGEAGSLEADAFRKLYPHQFYANFLAKQIRPDGRALLQARPVSVTPNAVSSADSSATAKLGDSAAIAGIKLEVAVPLEESPDEGQLAVGELGLIKNMILNLLCIANYIHARHYARRQQNFMWI